MPNREFVDGQGRTWRVWSTIPSRPRALSPQYQQGWLTFEANGEVRRCAPIPLDWQELSDTRLDLLCRNATAATLRSTALSDVDETASSGDLEAR